MKDEGKGRMTANAPGSVSTSSSSFILHPSSFLSVAQLVRLPNVFTAMADIALGALATGALPGKWGSFVLLLLASSFFYCSGMVFNDLFDLEQDRRERPFRPLPSGKVSRGRALQLGVVLMGGGLLFSALAGWRADGFSWPGLIVGGFLAAAIFLYDGWLKRTWAGPLGMGACRFLNVLLGLSVAGSLPWAGFFLALVVGLYIVGVTWFARREAQTSSIQQLRGAAVVMLVAVLLALALPVVGRDSGLVQNTSPLFPYLLVGLLFFVGWPVQLALANPTAARVQQAVKKAIFGLVLLDAVLATALAGLGGLAIALLLLPAFYLGRQLYST